MAGWLAVPRKFVQLVPNRNQLNDDAGESEESSTTSLRNIQEPEGEVSFTKGKGVEGGGLFPVVSPVTTTTTAPLHRWDSPFPPALPRPAAAFPPLPLWAPRPFQAGMPSPTETNPTSTLVATGGG